MNEVKKKLGNPIHVKILQHEKKDNTSTAADYDDTKIFVNNIDSNWDDCDLLREFKRYGEIIDVKISESDGKSNGYGFVKFIKSSSAEEAIQKLNGKMVNNRKLVVKPFIPWSLRESKRSSLDFAKVLGVEYNNLHVKNLHKSITENELKTLFECFGPILSVKIPLDDNGQSRGFGFVCFQKEENANKAREEMDHFSYKSKILEINFNQKKAERQKYLQAIRKDPKIRRFSGGTETEYN
ncbi:polyadenylate-binding protein 4 [Trichonephila inaurata madagascariensis]|uniref:Polyadenylate-binding protein 4 n=1 Tax=Trichonephila inaurata madagascariensis TaxID=2747483 RepID=A0A8X6WXN0_9ARAC|nr:polyadenylate-binding protein 4 [Trichonephila inaurata madagascariensis]